MQNETSVNATSTVLHGVSIQGILSHAKCLLESRDAVSPSASRGRYVLGDFGRATETQRAGGIAEHGAQIIVVEKTAEVPGAGNLVTGMVGPMIRRLIVIFGLWIVVEGLHRLTSPGYQGVP